MRVALSGEDATDEIAEFSSRGPTATFGAKPDLVAPGVEIRSSVPRSLHAPGVARFSGTSMAAPHVAGAAALVRQLHPEWPAEAVRSALAGASEQLDGAAAAQRRRPARHPGGSRRRGRGRRDLAVVRARRHRGACPAHADADAVERLGGAGRRARAAAARGRATRRCRPSLLRLEPGERRAGAARDDRHRRRAGRARARTRAVRASSISRSRARRPSRRSRARCCAATTTAAPGPRCRRPTSPCATSR